jgi:nucleosome binding factor SPN SPT16 subunit
MADEGGVKLDKQEFNDRLDKLITAWKGDKRTGDALFGGVGSLVILIGKSEEQQNYQKSNATHFWLLGYEFPTTLFVITLDTFYVVTTGKKGMFHENMRYCQSKRN